MLHLKVVTMWDVLTQDHNCLSKSSWVMGPSSLEGLSENAELAYFSLIKDSLTGMTGSLNERYQKQKIHII